MFLKPQSLNPKTILMWLKERDPNTLQSLWNLADMIRMEHMGDSVHLRGVVEFSNRCVRRCTYCGINAEQTDLLRYSMSGRGVLITARTIATSGCQTVVLQSGEDPNLSVAWMTDLIQQIKADYDLTVTLSLGEKPTEALEAWKRAGADRYLLKFETSNPELFHQRHSSGKHGLDQRLEQIRALKHLGYETGSGCIVGLPGQTYEDLVNDLLLQHELGLDMVAIGPYQPLNAESCTSTQLDQTPNSDLLTHICIALTRIMNPSAHIPATAALAASSTDSRWTSLNGGANVIMPNFTPLDFRQHYSIYPSDLRANSLSGQDLTSNIKDQLYEMGRPPALINQAKPQIERSEKIPPGANLS